jgi:hypothetical protein
MSKKEREEVELAFNLELETRKAAKGLAVIEKALRKTASRKVSLDLDKKSFSSFKKGTKEYKKEIDSIQKVIREVGGEKNFKKATANLDNLQKAHSTFEKTLKSETLKMSKARLKLKKQLAASDDALVKSTLEKQFKLEQKASRRRVEAAKKNVGRERRTMGKNLSGGTNALIFEKHTEMAEKQRKSAEAKEQGISDIKTAEVGREMGESFGDSVQALAGKDLLGFAKGGAKLSATMLKGAGKYGMLVGRNMQIKGAGMGGAGGAAMAGVGKMMSSIGPLVQTLSKLGPILGMAASSFGAIFKLILDIEGAAKEMNKQILEGASTAETFAASGDNSGKAFQNLSSTLDQIRADATSFENVKWGLKAEDIIRVTNTMNQQGVTLEDLKADFANAGKSADASARQVKGFGDMARMSFAYSKLMGVSLQEITDFQAEMFTELGQSLSSVQLGYARMTKDATESGIASTKFHSIIRGVSSDLSLYTTRMEQAGSMLKLLGKVMNPREAQKFMSASINGFKQMSEEDRLRTAMLAGEGKMRNIVSKDLDRKSKLLYNDIAKAAGVAFEDVVAAAAKGGGEVDKILGKVVDEKGNPGKQRGALKSALSEIGMDQKELDSGGAMGVANASQNLSMAGSLEAMKASMRMGSGKKLKDMTGMDGYARRKAANVSMEQFRAMVKLEESVDNQREEMTAALKDPKNPANVEVVSRLKALGITSENIGKASADDIIAGMSKSDQEAMALAAEQKDYAKETSDLTTTLVDKMGIVVDGIFNYLYMALKDLISGLNGIFDWIVSRFPGGGGEAYNRRKEEQRSAKLKETEKAGAQNFGKVDKGAIGRDLDIIFGGESKGSKLLQTNYALGQAGISEEKKGKFLTSVERDGDYANASKAAGLNPKEMQTLWRKALYTVGKDEVGKLSKLEVAGGSDTDRARARAAEGMKGPTQAEAGSAKKEEQKPAPASNQASTGPAGVGAWAQLSTAPIPGSAPSEGEGLVEILDINGRENVQSLQNLYDALRRRGIIIDKSQLSGPIKDTIRLGTLDAFREALFEQAVYSSTDSTALLQRMQESGFGAVAGMATGYKEAQATRAQGNATGGHVVGIADGKAIIAARGEGLASVGKGETIVPAGGRGGNGNITVNVNGIGGADLANHLKKKIAEGIYEYKRREKFQ